MHSVITREGRALLNSSRSAAAMVEEAAGLGRYKKRRESTGQTGGTGQNLVRVADIEGR